MPGLITPSIPEDINISAPWLDEFIERGTVAIDLLWDKYQAGNFPVASSSALESRLEIIPEDDLLVIETRDEKTNRVNDLQVQNFGAKDFIGNNFMGYTCRTPCFAFRGEKRHLRTFIDFSYRLIDDDRVEARWKTASEVKFPEEGLIKDLDYQDFASRVEIVEYAIWLKENIATDDPNAGESTVTILSVIRDGKEVVRPPPVDTQYDADVSLESEANHSSTETLSSERSAHTPEPTVNIPRIQIEPPSASRPSTEYLRPKSWSPITDGGQEEEAVGDLAMATTEPSFVETETLVDITEDEQMPEPDVVENNDEVTGVIGHLLALRDVDLGDLGPETGGDTEVITDGSLFGGSSRATEEPVQPDTGAEDHESMDLDEPEDSNIRMAANGQEETVGQPETAPEVDATDFQPGPIALPQASNNKADDVESQTFSTQSCAELALRIQTSPVKEIPNSQEATIGVDVPMQIDQLTEVYHSAAQTPRNVTTVDTNTSLIHNSYEAKETAATEAHIDCEQSAAESALEHERQAPTSVYQPRTAEDAAKAPQPTNLEALEVALELEPQAPAPAPVDQSQVADYTSRASSNTNTEALDTGDADKQDDSQSNSAPTLEAQQTQPMTDGTRPQADGQQHHGCKKGLFENNDDSSPRKFDSTPAACQQAQTATDRPFLLPSNVRQDTSHDRQNAIGSFDQPHHANGLPHQVAYYVNQHGHRIVDYLQSDVEPVSDQADCGTVEKNQASRDALYGPIFQERANDDSGDAPDQNVGSFGTATRHKERTEIPATPDVPGSRFALNGNEQSSSPHSQLSLGETIDSNELRMHVWNTQPGGPAYKEPPPGVSENFPSDETLVPPQNEGNADTSEAARDHIATDFEPYRFVSPLHSEDGTDPLALSDNEKSMPREQKVSPEQSYEKDAALAAQLAAEEAQTRRYVMRKRSTPQEAETPPAKKAKIDPIPHKKLPKSALNAVETTPKAPQPKIATPRKSSTKKQKFFREGARKSSRRTSEIVRFEEN